MTQLLRKLFSSPAKPNGMERRASVRYLCTKKASWHVTLAVGEQLVHASVRDLSIHGIGLLLDRQLEVGTPVTTELTNSSWLFSCVRLMQVANVRKLEENSFVIGCKFSSPLTYDQIFALLCK